MGAVYRASDEHLVIPVAVKENLFLTEEYGKQFQREAHILAGLRHPNLPHVTDYFSLENQGQYLVMDYIEGEDLRQRMERMGSLPEREAILIGISICDALSYLHNRHLPIVHRDIKPGNIKVTPDGLAVLVDFGLAKVMQGAQVTSTGARAMTPGYSPPEQYGTARTDPRSDIYSLGATLYAALTGVIPEDGLARMTGKSKLTPVRELASKVNRRLAETVERALEVDPDDRFQTAEDFKTSLIESGELASYYQDRPEISPPPTGSVYTDTALDDGEDDLLEQPVLPRSREQSRPKKRPFYKTRRILAPAALLAVAAALLLFLNNDAAGNMLAYLAGGPSGNASSTEVASNDTRQPTNTQPQPTGTEQVQTSDPMVTITPEPALIDPQTSVPTITPSPTATPLGGGMGQIAFSSDRTGNIQIWLTNADGKSAPRPITSMSEGACQPSWSPDGARLAFISPCPGNGKQETYPGSSIYILNIEDGSEPLQVTNSMEGDFEPAWSPDGKRIAFTSLQNGKTSIFLLNLDDFSQQELSHSKYPDRHPAWAPFGNQIAFVRQQFYTTQIWVMSDTGGFQSQISNSGHVNDLWPSWSPDGQYVFFSQTTPDPFVPWLVYMRYEDRGQPRETRISANTSTEYGPYAEVDPSPDGLWLAYEGWPDGKNHDIYIMGRNGANQRRLTTDPGNDFGAAWRPVTSATLP